MAEQKITAPTPDMPAKSGPDKLTKVLRIATVVVLGLMLLFIGYYAYAYLVTPVAIRDPHQAHYHFRVQIINDGQAVNFSDSKFQTDFNKDICSVGLTKEPFHFHDGVDQFVHVHWDLVTGGLFLKHYGWNFIGGTPGVLGYTMNGFDFPMPVKTHGNALPKPPQGAKYYVYTGTPGHIVERNWSDFLKQDLHDFLNDTAPTSFWSRLIPNAYAHGNGDGHDTTDVSLAKLNNFRGDIVIFAQKDKPTADQVKERFEHVVPLPKSQCSG